MKPLRTEQDYHLALTEIAKHFQHEPKPDTDAASRYHALASLIAAYEAKRWPITSGSSETEAAPCQASQTGEE